MIARQLYDINRYNKSNSAEKHKFLSLKSKQAELEDKMETYFTHHPLVLWAVAFVGMPIGILLAVGLVATIFGMMILAIISLI